MWTGGNGGGGARGQVRKAQQLKLELGDRPPSKAIVRIPTRRASRQHMPIPLAVVHALAHVATRRAVAAAIIAAGATPCRRAARAAPPTYPQGFEPPRIEGIGGGADLLADKALAVADDLERARGKTGRGQASLCPLAQYLVRLALHNASMGRCARRLRVAQRLMGAEVLNDPMPPFPDCLEWVDQHCGRASQKASSMSAATARW